MNEVHWTIVLAVVSVIFLCGFWFAPGGVLALKRLAGGEVQVDVRPFYRPETLYNLLESYGTVGTFWFRNMLRADLVFPAIYGAFLYLLADLTAHDSWYGAATRAAAISAALFDYGENLFLFMVLRRLPNRSLQTALAAGICTTLKFLSFVIALIGLAVIACT